MTESWNKLMEIPEAQWIVSGTVLLFAIMIAVYVAFFFRNLALETGDDNKTELFTGFRQMRDDGQLNEIEYSQLKEAMPDPTGGSQAKPGEGQSLAGQEKQTEKKFITLAEAQRQKAAAANSLDASSEENDLDEGPDQAQDST